ncbi:MAG TPA: DUF3943 domain-containing protein [Burkholderiaceae bacterium]
MRTLLGRVSCGALAASLCLLPVHVAADTADAPPPTYDRAGLIRDTKFFLGYQFVAVGVMSLLPDEDTNYQDKLGFPAWKYNVTHPQWDSDDAYLNYILHPYWGAAYYIRARERGLGPAPSFWYSALLSTIFEFGAEAMVERVSYQDLVVTPVLGSLLGEYVFVPVRRQILAQAGPLSTTDQVVLVLTDPLGAINSAVERMFGLDTQVSVGLVRAGIAAPPHSLARHAAPLPPSVAAPRARWGLQLRMTW